VAETRQPPPTWADVTLAHPITKQDYFNPVWLDWFVRLNTKVEETLTSEETTTLIQTEIVTTALLLPQRLKNENYTLVLEDVSYHIYKTDTSAYTWTIPANASVAFEVGTCVTFINGGSSGNITLAITSDTMQLAASSSTGSRTLAAGGVATAIKVASTKWFINGVGLS
jgi:hypothetical protein